jgi:hypothetical protein
METKGFQTFLRGSLGKAEGKSATRIIKECRAKLDYENMSRVPLDTMFVEE